MLIMSDFFFLELAGIQQHNHILDAEHEREKGQRQQKTDSGVVLQKGDEGNDIHDSPNKNGRPL